MLDKVKDEFGVMDNFKAVYTILRTLEKAMDYPDFERELIGHKAIGVSEERWARYIEMMLDSGYIKGASVEQSIAGNFIVDLDDIRITLKGIEYLQENSIMQQIYKAMKGIKEMVK